MNKVFNNFDVNFLQFRWIKNEQVAERATEVWEGAGKVIVHWFTLPASKRSKENKSYDMLIEHHRDSFMLAKLHFFKHVASTFKPFLTSFQIDNPMMPF